MLPVIPLTLVVVFVFLPFRGIHYPFFSFYNVLASFISYSFSIEMYFIAFCQFPTAIFLPILENYTTNLSIQYILQCIQILFDFFNMYTFNICILSFSVSY